MSATHSAEEIRLSQDRRDAILTFVLDYFTGDQIDRRTLAHFAFLAEVFGITAKAKDMVKTASSIQGRQELALSLALSALNIALDDSPPPPSARQLERKERREADKQFRVSLAGKSEAAGASTVKPVNARGIYGRPRASLSPEELAHVRRMANARQARWKAKRKAAKGS